MSQRIPRGYLNSREAAYQSRYSIRHVRELATQGHINSVRDDERVYVSAKDLKNYLVQSKRFLSLDDAVRESEYSRDHLKNLARKGALGRIKIGHLVYIFAEDLKNYIQPKGFLTLEEASNATGYTRRYFGNLANDGIIESVRRHEKIFVSSQDVEKYKLPKEYISQEDASKITGFTADHLKRAANKGLIRGTRHFRKVYFHKEDIVGYGRPPEGYLSLNAAAKKSGYGISHLSSLATQGRIGSVRKGKRVYISAEELKDYREHPGFLTLEESVQRSGYTPHYLRQFIKEQNVRTIKRRSRVMYSAEDLGVNISAQEIIEHILAWYDQEAIRNDSNDATAQAIRGGLASEGLKISLERIIRSVERFG